MVPNKSLSVYEMCIRDRSDFFAQYKLGNIHLNRVIEDHKVVQDIVDAKEYNAA